MHFVRHLSEIALNFVIETLSINVGVSNDFITRRFKIFMTMFTDSDHNYYT